MSCKVASLGRHLDWKTTSPRAFIIARCDQQGRIQEVFKGVRASIARGAHEFFFFQPFKRPRTPFARTFFKLKE